MITRGNFKTASANLWASKWRSLLTMLGIIIGISSVVTIVSLGEGLKHQIVGQIDNLGSDVLTVRSGKLTDNNSNNNLGFLGFFGVSTLTNNDVATIQKTPGVASVVPFNFITNSASVDSTESNNVYVIGTNGQMASVLNKNVAYGSFFGDDAKNQRFVVIGRNIAQDLFGQLNPVGRSITIKGQDFIVHGVLAPSQGGALSVAQIDFNSSIFMPNDTAKEVAGGNTNILQILVKAKPGIKPDALVKNITSALQATHGHDDFSVLKQEQLLKVADSVITRLTSFISGIAAISLLVGGIGIMDIMLVSVSERTREIGIRKSIGATNRQILSQFLTEGLLLSIGGGIIGIITSLLIDLGLKAYTHLDPIISVRLLLTAGSISVVVGIIFSTAPALKAARKDPIEALRA